MSVAVALCLTACGDEEAFERVPGDGVALGQVATARMQVDDQGLISAVVVGDLDGDGIDDAVVRTNWLDNRNSATPYGSTVYIAYGGAGLAGAIDLNSLPMLTGMGQLDSTVLGVGDVDGDGLADFLVGVPYSVGCKGNHAPDAPLHSGAYLVYGSSTRFAGTRSIADVGAFLRDPAECSSADAFAALGDLDGDGKADFALAAYEDYTTPQLAIYYGRGQRLSGTVDLFAGADTVLEPGPSEQSVVGVGDVDADGYADFIAGFSPTSAHLVRGGSSRLAGRHKLADVAATELAGEVRGYPGRILGAALGDLDGDGAADFALTNVEAPTGPDPVGPRSYHLYYGRAGGFGPRIGPGEQAATIAPNGMVVDVLTAADLDGDGHAELILGNGESREGNGSVRVLTGTATRWSGEVGIAAPGTNYVGISEHGTNCEWVLEADCIVREGVGDTLSVGDVTGDGHPDVLIGAGGSQGAGSLGVHGSARPRIYLLAYNAHP